jgi:chromosome partitioning protein
MGKIISFANQKGGVGKTTSAVNIAASLGVLGYNTLLVDLDPQGNATSGVGIAKKSLQYTIKDVLMGKIVAQEAVIQTEFQKLSLIPSNMSLAGTEFDLLQDDSPEPWAAMKNAFLSLKAEYDYIIIDCPPSLGMLTMNSLSASDGVVIPMQCEFYALEGLSQLMITISKIKAHYNNSLAVTGILLTMYTNRLLLTQQVKNELKKHYAGKLFETSITRGVKLSEAPGFGLPVYYHDKKSKGATEYLAVANELSTRI